MDSPLSNAKFMPSPQVLDLIPFLSLRNSFINSKSVEKPKKNEVKEKSRPDFQIGTASIFKKSSQLHVSYLLHQFTLKVRRLVWVNNITLG